VKEVIVSQYTFPSDGNQNTRQPNSLRLKEQSELTEAPVTSTSNPASRTNLWQLPSCQPNQAVGEQRILRSPTKTRGYQTLRLTAVPPTSNLSATNIAPGPPKEVRPPFNRRLRMSNSFLARRRGCDQLYFMRVSLFLSAISLAYKVISRSHTAILQAPRKKSMVLLSKHR